MVGIFKQKTPGNFIVLVLFGILIKLPAFLHPHVPQVQNNNSELYNSLLRFFKPLNPVIFPVFSFALLFMQAVLLTRIINNQRMMQKPNWLPGMCYLLVTSLFPEWNYLSAPLIINTIFLFVLSAFLKLYNNPSPRGIIFNIGFAIGLSTLIFAPALSFVVWVFMALMIMRPFKLTEWVLCIVGAATPFYFYAIWLFISDNWNINLLIPKLHLHVPGIKQTLWLAGGAALFVIPFLMGGYYIQESLRKMLIQVRKSWSLFLLLLIAAILVPFVTGSDTLENWIMLAIPFAAFHACTYLYSSNKIITLLVFWLSVAFIITCQYSKTAPGW